MAIDTESKRRSVHGYTQAVLFPVPAGNLDAADRAQATGLYAGLAYEPPAASGGAAPVAVSEDAVWLYRWSERRAEDDPQLNPWDTLNAWLVASNERQVDRIRVARLLGIEAHDREVMQVASLVRRRRR